LGAISSRYLWTASMMARSSTTRIAVPFTDILPFAQIVTNYNRFAIDELSSSHHIRDVGLTPRHPARSFPAQRLRKARMGEMASGGSLTIE
jgi:hypothetical protein